MSYCVEADPYIPEEQLGIGPSAKVYRAHDLNGDHTVRLKVLLTDRDSPCPMDREHLLAAMPQVRQIRHPQVCRLIALDVQEDDLTVVSEFSPGLNVWAFTQQRQVLPVDARALASQLIMALQAGEPYRLLHGDVKPGNVFIFEPEAGRYALRLQDWGFSLSRYLQPHQTLCYRAPELLHGGAPTPQSDLFSAGATIATMITGHAMVEADSLEGLHAAWWGFDPMRLRYQRPDLDPAFHDWLMWLLRLDPAMRPFSVSQALDVLMGAGAGFMVPTFAMPMLPYGAPPNWQPPQATASAPPVPVKQGPRGPQPKPPETSTKDAPVAAAAKPRRSKARLALILTVNLGALAVVIWFFARLTSNWGDDWPKKLRTAMVESLGIDFSIEPPPVVTVVPAPALVAALPAAPVSAVSPALVKGGVKAQFVRLELQGKEPLSLAEVLVFSGGKNIAPKGKATQQNTHEGAEAKRAIDWKTDGNYDHKSVTHTGDGALDPWWEVDLGSEQEVQAIEVWNRTDKVAVERLKNWTLIALGKDHKERWRKDKLPTPKPNLRLDLTKP